MNHKHNKLTYPNLNLLLFYFPYFSELYHHHSVAQFRTKIEFNLFLPTLISLTKFYDANLFISFYFHQHYTTFVILLLWLCLFWAQYFLQTIRIVFCSKTLFRSIFWFEISVTLHYSFTLFYIGYKSFQGMFLFFSTLLSPFSQSLYFVLYPCRAVFISQHSPFPLPQP